MKKYLIFGLLMTPVVASAQTLFSFFHGVTVLINSYLMPLLISAAVLVFIYNTIRYFIYESDSSDGQKKARDFMIWSILAFFIIATLWAIIAFILSGVGINNTGCERKVDTYVVGDNAPCTSPVPVSRIPRSNQNNIGYLDSYEEGNLAVNTYDTNNSVSPENNGIRPTTFYLTPSSNEETVLADIQAFFDTPISNDNPGVEPAGAFSDPDYVTSGECIDLLGKVKNSALNDSDENAYFYYQGFNGEQKLADITGYAEGGKVLSDSNKIRDILPLARNVVDIHTHPKSVLENNYIYRGGQNKSPSAADFNAACHLSKTPNGTTDSAVIDPEYVWLYSIQNDSLCYSVDVSDPLWTGPTVLADWLGIFVHYTESSRIVEARLAIQDLQDNLASATSDSERASIQYRIDLLQQIEVDPSVENIRRVQKELLDSIGITLEHTTVEDYCSIST